MQKLAILLPNFFILGACVYAESPHGRFMAVDLPTHTQTTIHKTVTVNAPAGTTVIVNDTPAVVREPVYRKNCYYERDISLPYPQQRKICL